MTTPLCLDSRKKRNISLSSSFYYHCFTISPIIVSPWPGQDEMIEGGYGDYHLLCQWYATPCKSFERRTTIKTKCHCCCSVCGNMILTQTERDILMAFPQQNHRQQNSCRIPWRRVKPYGWSWPCLPRQIQGGQPEMELGKRNEIINIVIAYFWGHRFS